MTATNQQLREQMWEFVYGLLSEAQAAEVEKLITSDPAAARAYALVKQQADLLSRAARLQQSTVSLRRPVDAAEPRPAPVPPPLRVEVPDPQSASSSVNRPGSWSGGALRRLVGLAATVLVCLAAYQYCRTDSPIRPAAVSNVQRQIAEDHLRVVMTGPQRLQAGVPAVFQVSTSSVDRNPVAAQVQYTVYWPTGEPLLERTAPTDDDGRVQILLPDDVPANSRLEIHAFRGRSDVRIKTYLQVDKPRYVTHLATDKPLYRNGETVYFRSLTLSGFALAAGRDLPVEFEILDPGGSPVDGSRVQGITQRGVGNGSFTIPAHLSGGTYTLIARSLDEAYPDVRHDFSIRRYRLPRLKKELEFTRDSYGPGDVVVADLLAERVEGGPAAGGELSISATIDGQNVVESSTKAAADGTCQVKFQLPSQIDKGAGTLAIVVDDGGNRETIAKTIPISLGKVDVQFYPEGGDLVAELENRVYFHAFDPLGNPVHVEGSVLDGQQCPVAPFKTTHEGRGVFSLAPVPGEEYTVEISNPADVTARPQLPAAVDTQIVVMNAGSGVFAAGQPIRVTVQSVRSDVPLVVSAVCRGVEVGQRELVSPPDKTQVTVDVPVPDDVAGVVRLTVYDFSAEPPKPIAERLVYRRPQRELHVRLADHSEAYSPGDSVKLQIVVTDETGQPVPAVLGVAVVDQSLLNLAEDKTPKMTTHFLLTGEIDKPEDLEDANFFLSDQPEAEAALDLLLGTQGWRRFLEMSLGEIAKADAATQDEHADLALRLENLAALQGTTAPPRVFDNLAEVQDKYDSAIDLFHAQRETALRSLGRVLFFGGLGVLIALTILGLLHVSQRVLFWLPSLVAATGCLVIGFLWTGARVNQQGQLALRPFVLFDQSSSMQLAQATGEALDGTRWKEGDEIEDRERYDVAENEEVRRFDDDGDKAGDELEDLQRADVLHEVADNNADLKDAKAAEGRGFGNDELGELGWVQEGGRKYREEGLAVEGELLDLTEVVDRVHQLRERLRRVAQSGDEQKILAYGKLLEKQLERFRLPVRQYAHSHLASEPDLRSDFAETVYWHPLLIADRTGRATISFDLSDSVTTFRVLTNAHGAGRLGVGEEGVVSRIPFSLEPKLPLEVNAGDQIDLPLAVNNDTSSDLPVRVTLTHDTLLETEDSIERHLTLTAGQRDRQYFPLLVVGQAGDAELEIRGLAGSLGDAVKKTIRVVPPGFPVSQSYAGQVEGQQELTVQLPPSWVDGSMHVVLQAFPSSLADLQKGLDSILQEPYGCFEQTSSSNYPNLLALQYMQQHDIADPAFTRRARELLKKGYARLIGFESPSQGYEWFGGDPGHEALTAYGLMEFRDMSQVWDVDAEMIERTARWLLARRDGQGGFQRNPQALDSFGGAPSDVTNAYVVWALTEARQVGVEQEVTHVIQLADASEDPYLIALAAASAINAGQVEAGKRLLTKLAGHQHEDGHLEAANGTITRSGGLSMQVETTALAALAWLKSPNTSVHANQAIEWLTRSRQGSGGFGSTQATVMALKALIQHATANRQTVEAGELILKKDGVEIGRKSFDAVAKQPIVIDHDELPSELQSGDNKLTIELTGDNQMPYALDIRYRTRQPVSDQQCPLKLTTSLSADTVKSGDVVNLQILLENVSGVGQPMTTAIVGLPAGLEPRVAQLDELKQAGAFDYYELGARELVFYWRSLSPDLKDDQPAEIDLDLVAEIPGRYTGPASRTYLYYTAEQKHWVEPLSIEIQRQ